MTSQAVTLGAVQAAPAPVRSDQPRGGAAFEALLDARLDPGEMPAGQEGPNAAASAQASASSADPGAPRADASSVTAAAQRAARGFRQSTTGADPLLAGGALLAAVLDRLTGERPGAPGRSRLDAGETGPDTEGSQADDAELEPESPVAGPDIAAPAAALVAELLAQATAPAGAASASVTPPPADTETDDSTRPAARRATPSIEATRATTVDRLRPFQADPFEPAPFGEPVWAKTPAWRAGAVPAVPDLRDLPEFRSPLSADASGLEAAPQERHETMARLAQGLSPASVAFALARPDADPAATAAAGPAQMNRLAAWLAARGLGGDPVNQAPAAAPRSGDAAAPAIPGVDHAAEPSWPAAPGQDGTSAATLASGFEVTPPSAVTAFTRAVARASIGDELPAPVVRSARGLAAPGAAAVPAPVSDAGARLLAADPEPLMPAAPAAEPTGINDGALERQIVRAIRLQWQNGIGEATIRLEPAHLGSLTVSLKVDGGAVSASVWTETEAAQQWIATHEGELRASLQRQGLALERLVVNQDSERQQRFARRERQPAPARPRRRPEGPDTESENYELRILNSAA